MYLKSLTLRGFKSFAQPTTFAFEPGVTCIVGPNGSGKSNVVDALAWVMGEQGVKNLRGGKMEDVIFAGTSTRGPLGRAQVTLTIDNTDGVLPIDYTEVTISRTLFRNGGSEYAINGEGCRLLDVQELLSDTGLGREMHVIVGQGQLDRVLHATPEDRRGFIEEAAGILKHRRRKEKTLRKLDGMQANLTRLSDLAGEIRRQLKPLGRQAEVARRAQTVAAVARDARARLLADDVVRLRAELAEHQAVETGQKSERIVLQERLDRARLRQQHVEQSMVGDDVDRARTVVHGLESVQERLRGLSSLANQRLLLLAQQSDQPLQGPTVTPSMVADAQDEADRLDASVSDAQDALAAAAERVGAARAVLDALDDEIAAQSALVSRHDLDASRLAGAVDVARSRLAAATADRERRERALGEAEERAARAEQELRSVAGPDAPLGRAGASGSAASGMQTVAIEGGAAIEDETALEGETALEARVAAARVALEQAQSVRDAARERLHDLERDRGALDARITALAMSLDVRDGSQAIVDAGRPGILGRLADHITVAPGFEAAIAVALDGLVDAVLAETRAAAIQAIDHARAADVGRIDVVVADASLPTGLPPALPGGFRRAVDVVTGPDAVTALLADVVIAEGTAVEADTALTDPTAPIDADTPNGVDAPIDVDAVDALLALAPGATVVTRSGDLVRLALVTGGGERQTSRIELAAGRDAAVAEQRATDARIAAASEALQAARVDAEVARAEVDAAERAAREHAAAVRERAAARAVFERGVATARARADTARAEADRLRAALDETAGAVTQAADALATAEAERDAFLTAPRPMLDASARPATVDELEAARGAEIEQRIQVETIRERVRAERTRAATLAAQLDAERAAAEEQARLAVIRRRQIAAAEGVIADLPVVLDAVDRSVSSARVLLAEAESARAARNIELVALRAEEQTLRDRLQALTDGVHSLEMEIYEKKLHVSSLLERAGSELGLVEQVLVAEYGPTVPVPVDVLVDPRTRARELREAERAATAAHDSDAGPAAGADAAVAVDAGPALDAGPAVDVPTVPYVRVEQERRLRDAERDLGQLGKVNPLALEEFQALEQRHVFLTEQLEDLTRTRGDLLTIIDELDAKMQTIFAAAFEDTRAAFDEVFPILFPGGSGSIRLTDPDDLLGTGIDVVVKPAGKKIDRLTLLSGGERSLAAIALLVAIFTARPSPFYIMDEVEAALDDANLGRLLTVFGRLRVASQLIVITHQKRTMEIADALYGVSMRQDGVSAVVGQRVAAESVPA